MSHIGLNIKRLRESRKETIGHLSKAIGVTHRALANIEKGVTTSPGIEIIAGISKHFSVTIDSLYYGTWDQSSDQDMIEQLKKVIHTRDSKLKVKGIEIKLQIESKDSDSTQEPHSTPSS